MTMADGLRRGEPNYKRASLAMLCAGLAIFNALYCTQALLPALVDDLHITPATAALTVSAATGALALCVVPASILSEKFGRGPVLKMSALGATALGLLLPLAPSAGVLIGLRASQGLVIAGVPAVAMTWLAEELDPRDLDHAMGLYIAGNTLGGLSGRLIPAGLLEVTTWRWALTTSSVLAIALALAMTALLPTQRRFTPKTINPAHEFGAMLGHLRDSRLLGLYAIAFLGMGTFVSVYNFFGFRMIRTYGLKPALVGLVFLMYLAGTWSSARAATLSKRYGRGTMLVTGAALMLLGTVALISNALWLSLIGLFIFTASFFIMHSVASSSVGIIARKDRAEASSMYLFNYYVGSSVIGGASGLVFSAAPWPSFVAYLTALVALALAASIALRRRIRS